MRAASIKRRKIEAQFFDVLSIRRFVREVGARTRFKSFFTHHEKFRLNSEQRNVSMSFAPETLVVAGAGTGKTTVLLGRSKYLFLDERADAKKILLLAFNKKASAEISERAKLLGLPIVSQTFHGFAKRVIEIAAVNLGENSPSMFSKVENTKEIAFSSDSKVETFLENCIKNLEDDILSTNLFRFFSQYMVPQYDHDQFETIEEYAQYVRSGVPVTLKNDRVKSHGEWLIANFLFVNQIPYTYEGLYVGQEDQKSWHHPDFSLGRNIVIEYFGCDKHGRTAPGIDAQAYANQIKWKREVHARNRSVMIELSYQDLKDGVLIEKLSKELLMQRFELKPLSREKILESANRLGYSTKLLRVLHRFLDFYRASGLTAQELENRAGTDRRSQVFIAIFLRVYREYLGELEKVMHPDFTGLILEATKILSATPDFLPFDQVMVDEFQDISSARWAMIEAIRQSKPDTHFTFVGDDWQAIYEFAGSDPAIMLSLGNWSKQRKRVYLDETFRMPQELCEVSGSFVMKNKIQIPKELIGKGKTSEHSPALIFHWDTSTSEVLENIRKVIALIGKDARNPKIELLVLGRYKKDLPSVAQIDLIWAGHVRVMTVHSSKGLEADYVIISDVNSSKGGFPSMIQDDPLLDLVRKKDSSYKFAGERRVFYVGITRARKECHVISSIEAPSTFALEFYNSGWGKHRGFDENQISLCPACKSGWLVKNVKLSGLGCTNWPVCTFRTPPCPQCSKPMKVRGKQPGSYVCTDHPVLENERCPSCAWGSLIEINGPSGIFLGCHLWISTKCKGSRSLGNFSYEKLEEFQELKDMDEVVLPPEITQPTKVPAPLLRERPGVKEQREAASAIYPRNGKRWNIDEDSSLVEAFLLGNSPVNISKLVDRSPSAVRGRIIYWVETSNPRLQFRPLKMSKSYARHGEGWTKSECDELKRLWESEISLLNLCEKLQRPKLGVTYKLLEMGIISMNKDTLKEVEKFYRKK
jgi:DNA helicase-4